MRFRLLTYKRAACPGSFWIQICAPFSVKPLEAQSLAQHGEKMFPAMSGWNGRARVAVQHPSGIFAYRGVQGIDTPEISVWEIDENARRVVRAEQFLRLAIQHGAGARSGGRAR